MMSKHLFRWLALVGLGSVLPFLVGCGQPVLSIQDITLERLQDDRVQARVQIRNVGDVRWRGSEGDSLDRFCVVAEWFSQSVETSFAKAERCYDRNLNAQEDLTLVLISSWTIPKPVDGAVKVQVRIESLLPNPGASTQQEVNSP